MTLPAALSPDARIYVAGHRGLVGSALMRRLTAAGYRNLITRPHAELELADARQVAAFFQETRPEFVFLAAAKVGGVLANNTYPADFIRENLAVQLNVIDAAWRCGVKRLLFLGSSCIYPRNCPQPIREEYLLTGPLEPTNRPYALAKIAGIEMCGSYNRQYGTHYLAVMPTNLYGPGDHYDLQNSHVLPALIRKFHLAKLAQQGAWEAISRDAARYGPIPEDIKNALGMPGAQTTRQAPRVALWGSGSPYREFLYSDDMANACLMLMNLPDPAFDALLRRDTAPLINIGCGEDQTIRELAERVQRVVGFTGTVEWDSSKPDGTPRKLLDISRIAQLGWRPTVELQEGIRRAYRDYAAAAT